MTTTDDAHAEPSASESPPLPLAVAVVVRSNDDVLLIKRAATIPLPGYWTPVTGRLEPDETLADAAHREVREEVGLTIQLGPELQRGVTSNGQFMLVYFLATTTKPTPLVLDANEVADAHWLLPSEALALEPMLPTTRAILTRMLCGDDRGHASKARCVP